jgi:hypothetical protein
MQAVAPPRGTATPCMESLLGEACSLPCIIKPPPHARGMQVKKFLVEVVAEGKYPGVTVDL